MSLDGVPVDIVNFTNGRGTLQVVERNGHTSLEVPLDELGVTYADTQYYSISPREFDTSQGGPYEVHFEVTEPFKDLEGTLQTLSARHFVSGGEVLLHYLQFGLACLTLCISLFLIRKITRANKQLEANVTITRVDSAKSLVI